MDTFAADLIIFGGSSLPFNTSPLPPPSLTLPLWHPAVKCRKMPKSAFKLKAIHLHISDYSVNLPSVSSPPPISSFAIRWNGTSLMKTVVVGHLFACVFEFSVWSEGISVRLRGNIKIKLKAKAYLKIK